MYVMCWLITFLIFKKQDVIFEAVGINFKCNGVVCVLSFFFGRQDFRIPCIVLFIWQDAYFSVTVGGFQGRVFFPKVLLRAWGSCEPWNLFSYFRPKSMIVLTLFQTWTKGKNDFRHMRDIRLVHGSYKRSPWQLTRIVFHLHSY